MQAPAEPNRVAVLDGWRGLAILLVLFDHVQNSLLRHYAAPWTQTGQHGVTVFFVLSGYLITSKLIEGPIDFRRFYVRRFFRLMPAAWTYLAFLFLLRLITKIHFVSPASVLANVLCYRNFLPEIPFDLSGHFWSLSLEEQFYLVWPAVLFFAGVRRSRYVALLAALACAGYRWMYWAHYDLNVVDGQSQVRADAPLVGCLLALLLADPRARAAIARSIRFVVLPAMVVCVWAVARCHWLPPLAECVAIASLIAATVLNPMSAGARPFAFQPLAQLGVLSYSIYIWQEVFMPVRSVLALAVFLPMFALGSYYLIERPCRNFGIRLMRKRPAPKSVFFDDRVAGMPLPVKAE